jgi:hypothetical protein
MKAPQAPDLEPYLEALRRLPFVKGAELRRPSHLEVNQQVDARLSLRTPKGRHNLAVEVHAGPIGRGASQSLAARVLREPRWSWIVFSPYVSGPVGRLLASHGIGFVDQGGNCHVVIGQDYFAHVEGRRPPAFPRRGRGLGASSYQVLFALLARADLVNAPIRTLAKASGVRKTTVADLLRRLRDEGFILRDRAGRRTARLNVLLERWVAGYADKLRPRLFVGRYRSAIREPATFEKHAEATLGERVSWAWGGATAAYRLTRRYRTAITTLHVATQPATMQRELNLLPARDGPVVVLGVPGPLGLDGPAPHVAHPLLVYTELVVEGDERATEAAAEIRSQFLGPVG